jgi:DNA-binding NtrC family response regulator
MRVHLQILKPVTGQDNLPLSLSLDLAEPDCLNRLREERKFGVYIIPQNVAEELANRSDLIHDRNTKPENKSLAQLLLNEERVQLIRCNYSSIGRLQQGVRAFLDQVAATRDRNIYFIAIPESLFTELWHKSERNSLDRTATKKSTKRGARDVANYDLILNLLPPVAIPQALEQTYVGKTLEAHLVRVLIVRAAASDDPVLILGDTGTGKEITARAVHRFSKRSDEKFVPVNCGSIPRELFESELFGIKGGVATNVVDRRGLWEMTGRGTLFLDEIGELSTEHQVKILRALEEGAVRRVGEVNERKVGARIVAATNRPLFSMVQQGTFRADLYYRLRILTIPTPAMRDVPEDFPILAQFLWKRVTNDESCLLGGQTLDELQTYAWPGNVRELKSVLKNIHALFGPDKIGRQHVRAVFGLLGLQTGVLPEQGSPDERHRHRMECLRHLRRVDEVLRACQVAVRSLTAEVSGDDRHPPSMRNLLTELELLLRRPLLFHDEVVFTVTCRLKDLLLRLEDQFQQGKEIASALRKELKAEFELALKLLFSEVSELLAV